jgi:aspartyl/asparaginyl beta-hydroxylase (cupin superfamily)
VAKKIKSGYRRQLKKPGALRKSLNKVLKKVKQIPKDSYIKKLLNQKTGYNS